MRLVEGIFPLRIPTSTCSLSTTLKMMPRKPFLTSFRIRNYVRECFRRVFLLLFFLLQNLILIANTQMTYVHTKSEHFIGFNTLFNSSYIFKQKYTIVGVGCPISRHFYRTVEVRKAYEWNKSGVYRSKKRARFTIRSSHYKYNFDINDRCKKIILKL